MQTSSDPNYQAIYQVAAEIKQAPENVQAILENAPDLEIMIHKAQFLSTPYFGLADVGKKLAAGTINGKEAIQQALAAVDAQVAKYQAQEKHLALLDAQLNEWKL